MVSRLEGNVSHIPDPDGFGTSRNHQVSDTMPGRQRSTLTSSNLLQLRALIVGPQRASRAN